MFRNLSAPPVGLSCKTCGAEFLIPSALVAHVKDQRANLAVAVASYARVLARGALSPAREALVAQIIRAYDTGDKAGAEKLLRQHNLMSATPRKAQS
jgi:hypothetical protein